MGLYYDNLVAGGQNGICVCVFRNTSPLTFDQSFGPCNGVCTHSFNCQGLTPVLVSNSALTTTPAVSYSSVITSSAASYSSPVASSTISYNNPTTASTAGGGGGSGGSSSSSVSGGSTSTPSPNSLGFPLVVGWKTLLIAVTFTLFSAIG